MENGKIVVIAPRLLPQWCGVGAYAWSSMKHWPGAESDWQFVVVDGAEASRRVLDTNIISEFAPGRKGLASTLNDCGPVDVILHYAGRAYQRFGCPIWMPGALRDWKTTNPEGKLLIFFHELPANIQRFGRHYIVEAVSRQIVKKLAGIADVIVTNTQAQADDLEAMLPQRRTVEWLPVPSNIPVQVERRVRGEREFVLFGLPFTRWQTLQMFEREIALWVGRGVLRKLHLVGPREGRYGGEEAAFVARMRLAESVVEHHGALPEAEVSLVLAQAQCALTNAAPKNWSKSGTFMAYTSHGCAIIARDSEGSEAPWSSVISASELSPLSIQQLREHGNALQSWYQEHVSWPKAAARLQSLLQSSHEA